MTWVEALLPTDSEPVGKLAQSTLPLPVWATVYQISRVLGGLLPWILERGGRARTLPCHSGHRDLQCLPPPPCFVYLFVYHVYPSLPFRAGSTSLPSALPSISVFYLIPYLLYSRSSLGPPYMGGDPPSPRGAGSYSYSSVTGCFQGTWGAGGVVCRPLVVTGVVIRSFLQYIVVILEFPGVGILSDLVCFPG